MKDLLRKLIPFADVVLAPAVFVAGWLLKLVRKQGVQKLPLCKKMLTTVGVFPIRDHYYEPLFDMSQLKRPLADARELPGIDWNSIEQLKLLEQLSFAEELNDLPTQKTGDLRFHFNNGTFESGDAEYWYQLIRHKMPNNIIEVGSGNSTLLALSAVRRNEQDDPAYRCSHVCIEPYENAWLEGAGVAVVRKKVEDLELSFFSRLGENDILFIDSSHMIRPQGDVLFEYLELIPQLNTGVIVHLHDIFSPRNYLEAWLVDEVRFWNEQYLLEAFLSDNSRWKVVGALNFLHHNHAEKLRNVCPYLTPEREPGSFYMQKIG